MDSVPPTPPSSLSLPVKTTGGFLLLFCIARDQSRCVCVCVELRLEQSLLRSRQGLQSLLLHPGILLPVQVTPVAELLLERVSRDIIVHLHHLGEVKLDKLCNQD